MNIKAILGVGRKLGYVLLLDLTGSAGVRAQAGAPFTMDKQFSSDQVITDRAGTTFTTKLFMDEGKMRTEMATHGMDMISLVLPAEQKVYSIMPAQKMIMVIPFDAAKFKSQVAALTGKYEFVGAETVEGVACNKYREVVDNKTFFLWADAAQHIPVKMTADDGSFTALWKNYHAGPQDPSLFVVPADYQTMDMPSMPRLPPGGTPGQ